MKDYIDPEYPSVPMLREKARKRIPRFAFEYLDGGCNNEVNLARNTSDIRRVQLKPQYLRNHGEAQLPTELFGSTYSAPFGISPIGLQGLMWPRASEILAKAAFEHQLPFILSTVATASIEKIGEITEGRAWFQLYHPTELDLRDKLIERVAQAGYPVLVILADTPTFGVRPKEIRNGLSIPPRMTLRNILQIISHPNWALQTLVAGQPEFKTLKPYIPKGMNLRHLGQFMNRTFSGRLDEDRVRSIRDRWKGKLVIKGISSTEDTQKAIEWGVDGIIISNHGGRQLDAGPSSIAALHEIAPKFKNRLTIMIDSGMRSGPDIANCLASGAEFTFLGRAFMYGVAALGKRGGDHTIAILKKELQQIMEQVSCDRVEDLPNFLLQKNLTGGPE